MKNPVFLKVIAREMFPEGERSSTGSLRGLKLNIATLKKTKGPFKFCRTPAGRG